MTYKIMPIHKRAKNIGGDVFGRLVVICPVDRDRNGHIKWLCICECLTEGVVYGTHLLSGRTKSCGCLNTEAITKHGMYGTPEYKAWDNINDRCNNQDNPIYKNYGGRGITVDYNGFEDFYLDVGDRTTPQHSIDRIDNMGSYTHGNCKWSTHIQQSQNRRDNITLTLNGETKCVAAWARISGLPAGTIYGRLKRGWRACDVLRKRYGCGVRYAY